MHSIIIKTVLIFFPQYLCVPPVGTSEKANKGDSAVALAMTCSISNSLFHYQTSSSGSNHGRAFLNTLVLCSYVFHKQWAIHNSYMKTKHLCTHSLQINWWGKPASIGTVNDRDANGTGCLQVAIVASFITHIELCYCDKTLKCQLKRKCLHPICTLLQ